MDKEAIVGEPFKSVKQAKWFQINAPDVFARWKEKYGLPQGFSKSKGKEIRYPMDTENLRKSHRKIHENHTNEDTTYYRRVHNKIVSAMKENGIEHKAISGNILDEAMPGRHREYSKWS